MSGAKVERAFVHDIQCCYYLLSVQSTSRLLLSKTPEHQTLVWGRLTRKLCQDFLFGEDEDFVFEKEPFEDWNGSDISSTVRCSSEQVLRLGGIWEEDFGKWSLLSFFFKMKFDRTALTWTLSKVLHSSRRVRKVDSPPESQVPHFNFSIKSKQEA